MNRYLLLLNLRLGLLFGVSCLVFVSSGHAAPPGYGPIQPPVQQVGPQQYRIGAIRVDKARHRFTLPAVVLRLEGPLEFLGVTRGSYRGYESLLELDANAYEFNLACILIGLDQEKARAPRYHFDPRAVMGDPVSLRVSWGVGDKRVEVNANQLLLEEGKPIGEGEWLYTGSSFTPDNRYLAELDGVLIGFAHDPSSIIEHKDGLAIGNYGGVAGNPSISPPVGSRVFVTVERTVMKLK